MSKVCSPISARRWLEEAVRRLDAGGDRSVIANEVNMARRLISGCQKNLNLDGPGRRRRRKRRRR